MLSSSSLYLLVIFLALTSSAFAGCRNVEEYLKLQEDFDFVKASGNWYVQLSSKATIAREMVCPWFNLAALPHHTVGWTLHFQEEWNKNAKAVAQDMSLDLGRGMTLFKNKGERGEFKKGATENINSYQEFGSYGKDISTITNGITYYLSDYRTYLTVTVVLEDRIDVLVATREEYYPADENFQQKMEDLFLQHNVPLYGKLNREECRIKKT